MLKSALKAVMVAAVASTVVQGAMFDPKGPVIELNSKNYKKMLSDGNLAIVSFTAPWCGHCKNLVPEYTSAAGSLTPLIPFYNIDCDEESNKPICGQENVKGFPTIKVFPKGGKGASRDYQGERTASALREFMSGMVVDKVKKIRKVEEIEEVFRVEKPTLPHALLLHPSSPSIPLLWKVLATRLPSVSFGFLKDPASAALKSLGVQGGEGKDGVRVVYWDEEGKVQVYDQGPLKFEPLLKFFTALSTGSPLPSGSSSSTGSDTDEPATPPPAPSNGVSDAELRAARRKAKEAKWAEEERRDRLRREKREAAKKTREAEEAKEEVHEVPQTEEALVEEGVIESAEATSTSSASSMDSAPTDIPEIDTALSPPTPLEAAAEDFEHGETPEKRSKGEGVSPVVVNGGEGDEGVSKPTELEEQAEVFEHGQSGRRVGDEL